MPYTVVAAKQSVPVLCKSLKVLVGECKSPFPHQKNFSFAETRKAGAQAARNSNTKMVITLITIVHIIVCLFLIIVVLLQSGKSGDIAAAFGGMGSQTAFGPRGAATALSKATTWSAVLFMVTSITLSIIVARRPAAKSVLSGVPAQNQPAQPAQPTTPKK